MRCVTRLGIATLAHPSLVGCLRRSGCFSQRVIPLLMQTQRVATDAQLVLASLAAAWNGDSPLRHCQR